MSLSGVAKRQQTLFSYVSPFRILWYNIRSIATLPKPVTKITHSDNEILPPALESIQRAQKYTLELHKRPTVMLGHGSGSYVYDANNRAYLDFTSGNALGHADPKVIADINQQSKKLTRTSNTFYNENEVILAEKLVETTNKYSQKAWAHKVVLCNSGNEANEGALKLARKWGKAIGGEKKTHIVCFENGFHGHTLGSLSVTPDRHVQKLYKPLLPRVDVLRFNDVSEVLHEINEHTAGVIVEPIQSEGGVNIADQEFLAALRKQCNKAQALLIYDETHCGMSRTGKLWAHQSYGDSCKPDVLTMASDGSLGAIITNKKVSHILTGTNGQAPMYGGNLLASSVVPGVIDRITNESFLSNVIETGYALQRDLYALRDEYGDVIKMVRGQGLLIGVEFYKRPDSIVKLARERGLLVATAANNTIRIIPPLVLTREEAREGIARFFGAIKEFI